MELCILEVIDAGHFVAREHGVRRFEEVFREVNDYFNEFGCVSDWIKDPLPDTIYIGRCDDKKWYRVIIENTLQSRYGPTANCLLIDSKKYATISLKWLRLCPPKFAKFPKQAKDYKLYGIQPVTLKTSPIDFMTTMAPCERFDQHATLKVKDFLNNKLITAEIIPQETDSDVTYIRLYAEDETGRKECLNEYLVEKDMAIYRSSPHKPKPPLADSKPVIQENRVEAPPAVGDSRIIHRRRNTPRSSQNPSRDVSDDESETSHRRKEDKTHSTSNASAVMQNNQTYVIPRMALLHAFNKRHCSPIAEKPTSINNSVSSKTTESSLSFKQTIETPRVQSQPTSLQKSVITADNSVNSSLVTRQNQADLQTTRAIGSGNDSSSKINSQAMNFLERIRKNSPVVANSMSKSLEVKTARNTEQTVKLATTVINDDVCAQNLDANLNVNTSQTRARLPLHSDSLGKPNKPAFKSILKKENTGSNSSGLRVKMKTPDVSSDDEDYNVHHTQYHGDILLRKLSHDVYKRKYVASVQQHCLDFVGSQPTAREDEIFIVGESIPNPFNALEKSPVGECIKKAMFDRAFDAPMKIQAYTWPAILRGSHVVGIAPSGTGKTLAYLVPLLSQLIQKSLYEQLPEGKWPKAIILSPSYKNCWNISDVINSLVGAHPAVKALVIHAVDCEESQQIKLINGCDLLVATPHCLLRMLSNQFMDLSRLCHLVLDDAHVLTEQFTDQIREIMTLYRFAVQDFNTRPTPMQKLMFASQWTRGINSFMEAYMNDPIVYITSQFEMSVYGNVKPVLHQCDDAHLNTTILDILNNLDDETKVVALTKEQKQAEQIYKLLMAQSRYALLCTHTMVTSDVCEMIRRWKQANNSQSRPVLIMTDGCVPEIQLKDANCIVHCDLPTESKTKFGRRLGLMSDYFKPGSPICTQHIIVTEKCGRQVDTLVRYLKRVGEEPTKKLLKLSHDWIWKKEENKSEQLLCHYLKAFGACRDINSCKYRHVLAPSDVQVLPTSGEVKVLIINVKNASQYYVRLLEHRRGNEVLNHFGSEYVNIVLRIAEYYGDPSNQHSLNVPAEGDMCVVEDNIGTFHRAKIMKLYEKEGVVETVQVFYIDDGTEKTVKTSNLYKLPADLLELPAQAVEVYVCRVKPVDKDIDWTPKVSTFVHALAFGKEIDGKVVLSLGHTMWLDPMVERSRLKSIKSISHNFNIRNELLQNNFADDNPTHIKCLYKLCEGRVRIPVADRQQSRSLGTQRRLDTEILPQSVDRHIVYLSAVNTPEFLFVQKVDTFNRLEAMMQEINSDSDLPGTIERSLISMDMLCLAKFSIDNRWYRARVICERDGLYEVFFIDYGDKEFVKYEDILHLPAKYTILPMQAIECKLVSVDPKGVKWDDEVDDIIWEWSHEVGNDDELINIEVSAECKMQDTCEPQYSGHHKYVIDLYDYERQLSRHLVKTGFAVASLDTALEIFPESLLRLEENHEVKSIPYLCAKLVREEVNLNQLQIAMDIKSRVDELTEVSNGGDIIYYLSQLVQYVDEGGSVLESLLESLNALVRNSESLLEEVHSQGGIGAICRTFHKTKSDGVRQLMSELFIILVSSCENLNQIHQCNGIQSLCLQLSLAEHDMTRAMMLNALQYLQEQDARFNGVIMSELDKLSHILTVSKSKDVLITCIMIMEQIVQRSENTEAFGTKNGISSLCRLLDKTKHSKVIISVVNLLGLLRNRTKAHRQAMFTCGLPEILQRLSKGTCSNESKKACDFLWKAMDPSASQTISLFKPMKINPSTGSNKCTENMPLSKDEESEQYRKELASKSVHPEVSWSQNKQRILLEIKVRGAKRISMLVEGKSFKFSTTVDFIHYFLDLEMFDELVREKCYSVIRGTILISLRKQENKRWPYLLFNRLKPCYLHVDYDRYIGSSSETDAEQSDDQSNPFVLSSRSRDTIPWDRYSNNGREMVSEAMPEFMYNGRHPGSDSATTSDEEIDNPHNFVEKKDPYHDMLNEMLLNSPRY
ncbi:uncharacterized protein LOC141901607 [Tubulanus polymorphus]|uniref:uncharacterized protein LOC141901607 n=1 Tax=Tubulanus polymorphus TaxID=672921 RepID=UPI003DA3DFA3